MKIVIVGIGDIGRKVVDALQKKADTELVLIDNDEKHCEHLANEVDAMVLYGDGTDPAILKRPDWRKRMPWWQLPVRTHSTRSLPCSVIVSRYRKSLSS